MGRSLVATATAVTGAPVVGTPQPKLFSLFPESQSINQLGQKARKRNGILDVLLAFYGEC